MGRWKNEEAHRIYVILHRYRNFNYVDYFQRSDWLFADMPLHGTGIYFILLLRNLQILLFHGNRSFVELYHKL